MIVLRVKGSDPFKGQLSSSLTADFSVLNDSDPICPEAFSAANNYSKIDDQTFLFVIS